MISKSTAAGNRDKPLEPMEKLYDRAIPTMYLGLHDVNTAALEADKSELSVGFYSSWLS